MTIAYTEPTYRHDGHVYHFSWKFTVDTPEAAVAAARKEFSEMWALSSVGWIREIVIITVQAEGQPAMVLTPKSPPRRRRTPVTKKRSL